MSLSSEAVNQSIFVAALFLTLISVPKLLVVTVWYAYKEWVFSNLEKALSKIEGLNKEGTAEILTKGARDPRVRMDLTIETLADFKKDIRDPLIEASTAVAILFFLIPLLPSIETWLIVILIVIVAVVIGAFALTVVLWRKGNKMLRMKLSSNPSLSLEP